ncbi:MAG: VOC family protein [Bacteroidota bacterium]
MSLPAPQAFLAALFTDLEPTPGALDHLFLDHICYRVTSTKRYESLRDALLTDGHELLVEGPINGRRISTFRLQSPIRYAAREIPLLELPEPKPGSPYPEGYEHVEFVTARPLAEFIPWLTEHLGIPTTELDRKGMAKKSNADVRVRLGEGRSVKFHERSLAEVIAEETRK